VDTDLTGALGGGAVGTFVGAVVIGAVLVALAPEYRYLALVFGSTIAFLAVADRLVDRPDDEWLLVLLVAAGINGGLVLSGVGSVVAFCVGAAGFDSVVRPSTDGLTVTDPYLAGRSARHGRT